MVVFSFMQLLRNLHACFLTFFLQKFFVSCQLLSRYFDLTILVNTLKGIFSNLLQRFGFDCNLLQALISAECICTNLGYILANGNLSQFFVIPECIF